MAVTNVGFDGTITETQLAGWVPVIGAAVYGVESETAWKASVGTGDRVVSLAAGTGWGYGVRTTTDTAITVTLDTVADGSRWDLIVLNRRWTSNTATFMTITGGTTKTLPARNNNPGVNDDQPIALVQVTAGQTAVTAIVDLRVLARNGGVIGYDLLALDYLNQPGASVMIGSTRWDYAPDTNNVLGWVSDSGHVLGSVGQPAGVRPEIKSGNALVTTNADGQARINFTERFPTECTIPIPVSASGGNRPISMTVVPTVTSYSGFSVEARYTDDSTPVVSGSIRVLYIATGY